MTGAGGEAPAPDREQRQIHRVELRHLTEEIGVAREVDGPTAATDQVPERFDLLAGV
jgi:hypothetical protein